MAGFRVKLTNKFSGLKLKKSFTKTYIKHAETMHAEAVRAWLIEVLKHIPTYTGTARGTYKPLSRVIRKFGGRGYNVTKFGPKGAKGNLEQAKKKEAASGGTRGFKAGEQYGHYKITRRVFKSIVFRFEAHNSLPYVLWNEAYPAYCGYRKKKLLPSKPPWYHIRLGQKAYAVYIKENFKRVARRTFKDSVEVTEFK